jgi:hypothetical protein
MRLDYVPLLPVQRALHAIPRDVKEKGLPSRFREYLRTMTSEDGTTIELPPLVGINPMAKDHVSTLLDALLLVDADRLAARAAEEASALLTDVPGEAKATLLVYDDWLGWTHRAHYEFDLRFRSGPPPERLPRWAKDFWVTAVLWSSEPASERAVWEAVGAMAHRLAYVHRHGPARTLRDMLTQEGHVMTMAGCSGPALDAEEIAYTREVVTPHLASNDLRTAIECLFGDEAAYALGFTPRGLSPWAGLALALHDAMNGSPGGGAGGR